jgi:hypothetical protein
MIRRLENEDEDVVSDVHTACVLTLDRDAHAAVCLVLDVHAREEHGHLARVTHTNANATSVRRPPKKREQVCV